MPAGKFWSDDEEATLRRMYGAADMAEIMAALPGRSVHSIRLHARVLGVDVKRHWSAREKRQLMFWWHEGIRVKAIAARLKRSPVAVTSMACKMGLSQGAPPGWEHVTAAARRLGFANPTLLRIAATYNVPIKNSIALRPRRAFQYHHQIVETVAIDDAVQKWLATENVGAAARARGIDPHSLRRLLGLRGSGKRHVRIPTEQIDRVVADWLPRLEALRKKRRDACAQTP